MSGETRVHIRKNDPRAVADFIQEHRAPLEALMTKPAILSMEIQALAMAKDAASARVAFEENKDIFEAEVKVLCMMRCASELRCTSPPNVNRCRVIEGRQPTSWSQRLRPETT
jgi:hypothetical protein